MANEDVLLRQASQLRKAGRVTEAIRAYQKLLAVRVDLPDSWYNLALLQRQARQYEAALESYQQALRHGLRGPEEAHLNRAVILSDHLARPDAARAELEAALRLNPAYVPALLNLGNLSEDRGDRARAIELYERSLLLEPGNALALARLVQIKPIRSQQDPLLTRIRQLLARPDLPPEVRANLGFALGKVLDDCADYEQAFSAYAAANRASRLGATQAGQRYDARAQEIHVDHVISSFSAPVSAAQPTSLTASPIFICGMFRSGSTLTETILSCHSQVVSGGEMDVLPALVRQHLPSFPEGVGKLSDGEAARLRRIYDNEVAARFPGRTQLTDKRPENFLYIGLIKRLFPDARIVHTRRHPLDNCL
jgi:tetratricopeptide (TPR) repeat protein